MTSPDGFSYDVAARDLVRFNDYVIEQKRRVDTLRNIKRTPQGELRESAQAARRARQTHLDAFLWLAVESALGPPGTANPYNVPMAAAALGAYAAMFEKPTAELQSLAERQVAYSVLLRSLPAQSTVTRPVRG